MVEAKVASGRTAVNIFILGRRCPFFLGGGGGGGGGYDSQYHSIANRSYYMCTVNTYCAWGHQVERWMGSDVGR